MMNVEVLVPQRNGSKPLELRPPEGRSTLYSRLLNRLAGPLGELTPFKQLADSLLNSGAMIFMFHQVLPRGSECFEPELVTCEDTFSEFLDWIAKNYHVVEFDELASRRKEPSNRNRPECVLTFDDGWRDNFTFAFPHLRRRGFPATIFLATRFIGTDHRLWQERLWLCLRELKEGEAGRKVIEQVAIRTPWLPPLAEDSTSYACLRRWLLSRSSIEAEEFVKHLEDCSGLSSAFPGRAFLNWEEVREMQRGGITFGSHTVHHTLLANASPKVAEVELRESRAELEDRLNERVTSFAYPWGSVGRNSLEQLLESGYSFAATTSPGVVKGSSHPYLLPRLAVSESVLTGQDQIFNPGRARLYFAKQVLTAPSAKLAKPKSGNHRARIKILFVLDLITEWEGGTERQLQLLIQLLDPKYFEPRLCFLFQAPELPEETLPCPLLVVSSTGRRTSKLGRLWHLIMILKQERPDIVQCFFIEGLVIGILAGRLAGVPRVVGSVRNAGHWRSWFHRLAMRAVTPLAHRWQANSRAMWSFQNSKESVTGSRIEILPNGIDMSRFVPVTFAEQRQARVELGLRQDGPICVSVANLAKVKNLRVLIESAANIRQIFPNLQIVLVGDGSERRQLESLTKGLGVSDTVKFVGRQSDVRPFLAAADVGVLTSHSEGSSNSVLEYMAMGLPSVVSDIQANRELMQGLFFRPGDAADLTEKLLVLLGDADLRSRLRSEYQEMVSQFSIEKFVLRAESFYNKLGSEAGHA
jgi:glycosyltransferase involved in cell wall biosynthesis/peptidoglycan/xylan/chitin deacetylase (PgdA/CDA1 family)